MSIRNTGDPQPADNENSNAGKMPAPQPFCGAGFQPAECNCGAGFQPAECNCGAGFQPANVSDSVSNPKENIKKTAQKVMLRSEALLTAGSCILREPKVAKIVQDALLHFEGKHYLLSSWCIMPNHVHLVVTPLPGHDLSTVLHSWKSFTSNRINQIRKKSGSLWERESFNHLIRSEDYWKHFVQYIEENPVEAKLCSTPEEWPFSSRGMGFQHAPELELADPRVLSFAPVKSRGELPHIQKEGATCFVTFRLLDAIKQAGSLHHKD